MARGGSAYLRPAWPLDDTEVSAMRAAAWQPQARCRPQLQAIRVAVASRSLCGVAFGPDESFATSNAVRRVLGEGLLARSRWHAFCFERG